MCKAISFIGPTSLGEKDKLSSHTEVFFSLIEVGPIKDHLTQLVPLISGD